MKNAKNNTLNFGTNFWVTSTKGGSTPSNNNARKKLSQSEKVKKDSQKKSYQKFWDFTNRSSAQANKTALCHKVKDSFACLSKFSSSKNNNFSLGKPVNPWRHFMSSFDRFANEILVDYDPNPTQSCLLILGHYCYL